MTDGTTTMQVVCASSRDDLARHLDAWQALAGRAPYGEWWAGPDWIIPWLTAFEGPYEPAVFFAYGQSRLVGVVPMLRYRRGPWGSTHWTLPRNAHVRRIGWLSEIPPADLLTAVFGECLRAHPFGTIEFPQVPEERSWEDPLARAIAANSLRSYRVEESRSAVADLAEGWDAYVSTRDGKLLRSLKRHLKRLSGEEGWQFELHHAPSTVDDAWNSVLDIERRSWKHASGTSIANEPGTGVLYGNVARRFAARDALQLWILRHEGRAVSHALGVVDRGCYYLLKNSFDEAYRSLSPGVALVWHAMREATERGARRVDFLGDATEWKRPLATRYPAYFTWTIFPRHHAPAQWRAFVESTIKPLWRRARGALPGLAKS